jgi:ribosomal protein S18 acetylase RimI-like enzyme|tara:strand:- start:76 stop:546 length:471 start_codon:yes stop_codon:yes gene_type:complete
LRENGADLAPAFQPMSQNESRLTEAMKSKFYSGIQTEINTQGWRKILLAFDDGKVIGHIDIRPHTENHTSHRALLGMGVDSSYRGNGLGSELLSSLFEWAAKNTNIECIDLWVLSSNKPAYLLYEKYGFINCAEVTDMFRIDGVSLSYSMMSRQIV